MRKRLEYGLAWGVLKFLGLLPRPVARWTAARLAALLFPLRPVWRRTALFNLRLAFPDWQDRKQRRVVRDMVRNLGWLAAEFAHFPSLTRENIGQVVVFEDAENLLAAERRGRGVLLLSGHMGAWELSGFAVALYSQPLHFLMRAIDNARVDALVKQYRCLSGNQFIDKDHSARASLRVLREGHCIGILADHNSAEDAIFVDFFGIPAATTTGVARLARHTGAAVVPTYTYWDTSLGKYRLCCDPPLALERTSDEQADIQAYTVLFNQVIESYIRRFPDQWLWIHRRWKTRPPGESPIYPDQEK